MIHNDRLEGKTIHIRINLKNSLHTSVSLYFFGGMMLVVCSKPVPHWESTLPPIIMEMKMGVSPIVVTFQI